MTEPPSENMAALADLRVLDLSTNIAGPYCTKLFADFGADVIKVERPSCGDEARLLGPFRGDVIDPEASGLFLYLNTNKRGVTLSLETDQGRAILRRMAETADVVVESFAPGKMTSIGIGFTELEKINDSTVLTSVTPFGQSGPWKDYQSTDIVAYAASGLSYVNGTPDREPIKEPMPESDYQAGLCAFVGTMLALAQRDLTGTGQHVDVSTLESATSMFGPQFLGAMHSGRSPSRRVPGLYPCKDGYVSLNVRHEPTWQYMWLFFGEPGNADDPRFTTAADRRKRSDELEALLLPYLALYTREELFHGLSPLRILVGMVLDTGDVVNDPHLAERDFFHKYEHPVAGEVVHPGAPFKMSATPWALHRPAPLLGQHNGDVYCGELGISGDELRQLREQEIV